MAATAFVRARIDEQLKNEAAGVLAQLGLTVSDVVRMTLTRIATEKALPLELSRLPNAETRAAIEESRKIMEARRARYPTAQALLDALDQEVRCQQASAAPPHLRPCQVFQEGLGSSVPVWPL